MPVEAVANIVISGLLTGLVYGLMALGLSVIYGVVRIVNFAHGEIMTMAMYAAVLLFAAWGLDPLWMMLPVVIAFFAFGYGLQRVLINPFIDRPEHAQFMLLLAVALVLVNGLLIGFGPDARNVQVDYALDSYQIGDFIVDKVRVICAVVALAVCGVLFAHLPLHGLRQGDPGLRRQPARCAGGGAQRAASYALTFGLGTACVAAAGGC